MSSYWIDIALLALLVITAIGAISVRSLLAASMLLAIYSLVIAVIWVELKAIDVAFTEAAVGAGISTILLIGTLTYINKFEDPAPRINWTALAAVIVTGAALIYGTLDMPRYGDPNAPPQLHVAPYYIERSLPETKVPNMVTAVLASYRGYDTMFETAVIFTAGIGVILLLRTGKQKKRKKS
jgi:multicomponent Na+:H+ antiporter subunit B